MLSAPLLMGKLKIYHVLNSLRSRSGKSPHKNKDHFGSYFIKVAFKCEGDLFRCAIAPKMIPL